MKNIFWNSIQKTFIIFIMIFTLSFWYTSVDASWTKQISSAHASVSVCNTARDMNNKTFPDYSRSKCFKQGWSFFYYICNKSHWSCVSSNSSTNTSQRSNNIIEPETQEVNATLTNSLPTDWSTQIKLDPVVANSQINRYRSWIDAKLIPKLRIITNKFSELSVAKLSTIQKNLLKLKSKYKTNEEIVNIVNYLLHECKTILDSKKREEELANFFCDISWCTPRVSCPLYTTVQPKTWCKYTYSKDKKWCSIRKEVCEIVKPNKTHITKIANSLKKRVCNSYEKPTGKIDYNWISEEFYSTHNIEFCWEYIKVDSPYWLADWWYTLYSVKNLSKKISCGWFRTGTVFAKECSVKCEKTDYWICPIKAKTYPWVCGPLNKTTLTRKPLSTDKGLCKTWKINNLNEDYPWYYWSCIWTDETKVFCSAQMNTNLEIKILPDYLIWFEWDSFNFKSVVTWWNGTYKYAWNFWDNIKSTTKNPSYTYKKEWTYSVSLEVTDNSWRSWYAKILVTVRPLTEVKSCPAIVMPAQERYSNKTCKGSFTRDSKGCKKYSIKCEVKKECRDIKPIINIKKSCTYKKVRNNKWCYIDKETCPEKPACPVFKMPAPKYGCTYVDDQDENWCNVPVEVCDPKLQIQESDVKQFVSKLNNKYICTPASDKKMAKVLFCDWFIRLTNPTISSISWDMMIHSKDTSNIKFCWQYKSVNKKISNTKECNITCSETNYSICEWNDVNIDPNVISFAKLYSKDICNNSNKILKSYSQPVSYAIDWYIKNKSLSICWNYLDVKNAGGVSSTRYKLSNMKETVKCRWYSTWNSEPKECLTSCTPIKDYWLCEWIMKWTWWPEYFETRCSEHKEYNPWPWCNFTYSFDNKWCEVRNIQCNSQIIEPVKQPNDYSGYSSSAFNSWWGYASAAFNSLNCGSVHWKIISKKPTYNLCKKWSPFWWNGWVWIYKSWVWIKYSWDCITWYMPENYKSKWECSATVKN